MTILTKPTSILKIPLVQEFQDKHNDEHKVDVPVLKSGSFPAVEGYRKPQSWYSMRCITATAFLVVMTGFASGLVLYHLYLTSKPIHNYQGYFSVPLDSMSRLSPSNYRIVPGSWNTKNSFEVFSNLDNTADGDIVNALHEILDIDGDMESIFVSFNGQKVNFINDFATNTSGIVELERCFFMDLDPEMALSPEVLSLSLQRGASLDTSLAHSALLAQKPAMESECRLALAEPIQRACYGKPVYRLAPASAPARLRKRSAADSARHFVQFAGRHVHHITVDNYADLLDHE